MAGWALGMMATSFLDIYRRVSLPESRIISGKCFNAVAVQGYNLVHCTWTRHPRTTVGNGMLGKISYDCRL